MKKLPALALLVVGLFSYSSFAQTNCDESSEQYRVFFVNGIRTSLSSAVNDRYELLAAIGGSHNAQAITYDLAYNHTRGTIVDLLQSIDQRIAQEGLRFDRRIMSWLNELGVVPDWLTEINQRLYSAIHIIQASELRDHVAKYREAILQGQKVLLVAHSQGNLYANASFDLLASSQPAIPMQSFGIFGVAAPTSYIAGGGGYLTNHRDIIQHVPGALGQNWTLRHNNAMSVAVADDVGSFDAHSFSDTYLAPWFNVRSQLQVRIRSALTKLVDPPEIVGSGPITVTMTWNTDMSDVDLHVFEPNNMHIYYASPFGTSGYLDVDDTSGYGPEHYYTDCNQLQLGEYIVGVNYFSDHQDAEGSPTRPAVAEFTVSVPGSTRTFRATLTSTVGSAVDQSPIGIGRIKVERTSSPDPNLNQRLKYSIFPY